MGARTGISWTDKTRNFWTGCTKVGPGCDGCYAESFVRWTRGRNDETGESKHWGAGAPRLPHLETAEQDLLRWDRQAAKAGTRPRVFINSQSDFFDNEVAESWRAHAWRVIRSCSHLTFQLLTKRIGLVPRMLPADWGAGYPNVWIGATLVNPEELHRDIWKLIAVPARVRWISHEPALGPLPLTHTMVKSPTGEQAIHWVVTGGESNQGGHLARPYQLEWVDQLIALSGLGDFALFVKQTGSSPVYRGVPYVVDAPGDSLEAFLPEHRVRQFPEAMA